MRTAGYPSSHLAGMPFAIDSAGKNIQFFSVLSMLDLVFPTPCCYSSSSYRVLMTVAYLHSSSQCSVLWNVHNYSNDNNSFFREEFIAIILWISYSWLDWFSQAVNYNINAITMLCSLRNVQCMWRTGKALFKLINRIGFCWIFCALFIVLHDISMR